MGTPAIHLNDLFTATSGPGVVPGTTNDGMSESCAYSISTLTVTSTTGQKDSDKEMWTIYMKQVKEYDKRMTVAWKEDANGILVFVSRSLLIPPSIAITAKRPVFSLRPSAHLSSNSTKSCPPIVAIRQ